MVKWWWASAGAALFALGTLGGCSAPSERAGESLGTSQQAAVSEITFTLAVPRGVSVRDTFISATDRLEIDDRVVLGAPDGVVTVANVGNSGSNIGSDTLTNGNVHSESSVTLRSRAHITGTLRTDGGTAPQDGVRVDGGTVANAGIERAVTTWSVPWPATNGGDVHVPPDQQRTVAPGAYAALNVQSRSKVYLSAGTYYFESFNTEPQAEVIVDAANGPLIIYVRNSLTYKGSITQSSGAPGRVFIGYAGSQAVFLQAPYVGALVAPNAAIELQRPTSGQHKGSFFGKRVHAFSDSTILHVPFAWDFLCPVQDGQCSAQCPANVPSAGSHELSVDVPRDLQAADIAMHSQGKLVLRDGAKVRHARGGFAPVTSSGATTTALGSGVETGHLFSIPAVTVGSSSTIHGVAHSEGSLSLGTGSRVTETIAAPTDIAPLASARLRYTVPSTHQAGITLTSASAAATPGVTYGATSVGYGSTLTFAAGEYHFESLSVADGGLLSIDNQSGPVRIVIHGAFTYAGLIREAAPDKANVLFAMTSCNAVTLSGPFRGTLFAPSASIFLKAVPAGHRGSFFGASVEAEAGTVVRQDPFTPGDCGVADDGCGKTFGCPAVRACPTPADIASVTPIAECVMARPDGSFFARFGYESTSSIDVSIPAGADNQLSSGSQFQPETFRPGRRVGALDVKLSGSLTWKIGNKQATLTTSSARCSNVVERLDAPIHIVGVFDTGSGQSTPGTGTRPPTEFEIPKRLPVSLGGAGNGVATLTFRDPAAGTVVCSYRGGSRVAAAMKDVDRARGRFYHFVSCSNGAAAGSSATGNEWTVNVVSADPTYTRTEVTAQIGPGCAPMEAPIPADISIQTRQAFSWQDTQPLPETDPAGLPALYYTWIYVERREQLDALRRMRIYHRVLPLFGSELSRYTGKCGSVDTSGDGTGIFVHALVPAAVFNLWRSISLVVLNRGSGTIPFRAVQVLPAPEPDLMNSDGLSLSWAKIKGSGLIPFGPVADVQAPLFGVSIPIVDDVVEVVEDVADGAVDLVSGVPIVGDLITGVVQIGDQLVDTAISIAPTFDEIIEATVDLVETVQGVITDALGELEQFLFGSIDLHLNLTVLNRDPLFNTDSAMLRGWGKGAGDELSLSGMRVEVHKWSDALYPTMFHGTVQGGAIDLRIGKGGAARGESGLCVSLENDAAMMSSGITENEFCDFREMEFDWGGFEHDITRELRLNDWQLHAFNQISDGASYARSVLGLSPRQAEVGVGTAANIIAAGNDDQPLTVCLNFPEGEQLLVEYAAGLSLIPVVGPAVGAAGLLATPVIRRDMFLPDTAAPRDSRGIVTHEYGHFIMCNILHNIDYNGLLRFFSDRVPEGDSDSRDDDKTVQSEAFADFIMTQVTGGANYASFNNTLASNNGNYCVASPCIEENFRGRSEAPNLSEFNDESRRFTSLLHDAVDRRNNLWRRDSSLPTNADVWTSSGPNSAVFTRRGYLRDRDDRIELHGSDIVNWWYNALPDCAGDVGNPSDSCEVTPTKIQRGLARTAYDRDASWCQVCELIINHSRAPEAVSATTVRDVWQACVDTAEHIVGAPPSSSLRLDASDCSVCPSGTVSDPSGQCLPCASNEVVEGNTCVVCPPGSIIDANRNCVPCGAQEISQGNDCVACAFHQTPDRTTNTCVDCPADVTVDWRALPSQCPVESVRVPVGAGAAGDTCPNAFWVELRNIDDALARALSDNKTFDGFRVGVSSPEPDTQTECVNTFTITSRLLGDPGAWIPVGGAQSFGSWTQDICVPGGCGFSCNFAPTFIPASEITSGQKNMRVLGRAQRSTLGVLLDLPAEILVEAQMVEGGYGRCEPR